MKCNKKHIIYIKEFIKNKSINKKKIIIIYILKKYLQTL